MQHLYYNWTGGWLINLLYCFIWSIVAQMLLKTQEKIVVIIPTYNEADCIEKTIHRIFSVLQTLMNYTHYVIIFDSNSQDNTAHLVQQLQKKYSQLILLSEPQKTGLGSAYHQAMNYSLDTLHADIIFECDADLSHQPEYIPTMVEYLKEKDCVIGSRYVEGGSVPGNWPWHRRYMSMGASWAARFILTPKYRDFTSGFRGTRHKALRNALPEKFISNNYAYKLELLWRLHQNKVKIHEIPIAFRDREAGKSKLPPRSIRDFMRVISILRLKTMEKYFKMVLIGFLGLMLQLIVFNVFRPYWGPFFASQISVMAAMIHNFVQNGRYTFKTPVYENSSIQLKRGVYFLGYSILMILFQSFSLKLCVSYFGPGPIKENLFLLIIIFIASILNYLVYSHVIWKRQGGLVWAKR